MSSVFDLIEMLANGRNMGLAVGEHLPGEVYLGIGEPIQGEKEGKLTAIVDVEFKDINKVITVLILPCTSR